MTVQQDADVNNKEVGCKNPILMSKPKAYIIGAVYLPIDTIDTKKLEKELHVIDDKEISPSDVPREIKMYHYETINGVEYIAIPRAYGEQYFDNYNVVDWTAEGSAGCLSDLSIPTPRPHQPQFIDAVTDLMQSQYDVVANAPTGMGKTMMAVEVARRLNTSTLIIVDQVKLGLQWVDTLTRLFGMPEDQIGHYSGYSKDYEGKPICIATLQTLYRSNQDDLVDFYDSFGCVLLDEIHSAGAPKYGTVLMHLSSMYRLGVSATTDRGDKFQKVLHYNLGEVAYTLPNNHDESSIRYIEYDKVISSYANNAKQIGTYESELASDGERNLLLAEMIKCMYDEDRDILVISARALQLQGLMTLCKYLGVPGHDMGVYSQTIYTIGYCKDKKPPFRLDEWGGDNFYTSVKYDIYKITSKVKIKEIQDNAIKAKIIFSTYSMFSKGVDVPRLSVGIDATPRSKVVQAHGRILRSMDGKPVPIWVTIRDINNVRSESQFMRRLGDYAKSNAKEVKQWDPQKGLRTRDTTKLKREVKQNANRLLKTRILRSPDGLYELENPQTKR